MQKVCELERVMELVPALDYSHNPLLIRTSAQQAP